VALYVIATLPLVAQEYNDLAANRLVNLQADITEDNAGNGDPDQDLEDGGWDWQIAPTAIEHSSSPSPTNLFGIIGHGLRLSRMASGGSVSTDNVDLGVTGLDFFFTNDNPFPPNIGPSRFTTALLDAARGMSSDPEIDSACDIVFLVELDGDSPGLGLADLARTRYDDKIAAYGSALLLGEAIRDFRGGIGQDGFIAYDIDWHVQAAQALDGAFPSQGYDIDATTFAQVIADDINNPSGYFDADNTWEYAYTIGAACSAAALNRTGIEQTLMQGLYDSLITMQKATGAFKWNSGSTLSNLQATAYAVFALALNLQPGSQASAQDAVDWLLTKQQANGGWISSSTELPTINSEILIAFHLVTPTAKSTGGWPSNSATPPCWFPVARPLKY